MAIKFKFCFVTQHFALALGLGRHLPLRRLPTSFILFFKKDIGISSCKSSAAAEINLEAGIWIPA
eukprot:scaffold29069_cov129-Skeletonema_marinoi.AAC.1